MITNNGYGKAITRDGERNYIIDEKSIATDFNGNPIKSSIPSRLFNTKISNYRFTFPIEDADNINLPIHLDFSQALNALKLGEAIRRATWLDYIQPKYIYLEDMLSFKVVAGVFEGTTRKYSNTIVSVSKDHIHMAGWTPNQSDMFANDWVIVNYE